MATRGDERVKSISEMMDLTGQVAIVTGGAEGLGLAVANRLSEAGAGVVINDLSPERVESAIAALGSMGAPRERVVAAAGDISRRETAELALATALEHFGRLDILINNAAIYPPTPFMEMTDAEWERIIDVNLNGAMRCCQIIGRHFMAEGHGGRIVNVVSRSGIRPMGDDQTAYGVSKAGLRMLTAYLAKNLGPHGIRVNEVSPGPMESPGRVRLHLGSYSDSDPDAPVPSMGGEPVVDPAITPLGRSCTPDEVARGVLFLASGLGDYLTGATLVIDGGRTYVT
jgi:NAD(P)-dependent dehydrogenase (short-subunit alcohol dehydrogenase family)